MQNSEALADNQDKKGPLTKLSLKIQDFDYELASGMQKIRTKFGKYWWWMWTMAGYPFIWSAIGIVFIFLDMFHVCYVILFAGLSWGLFCYPIKKMVQRKRPYDKHNDIKALTKERDSSFPSGHTYFATVTGLSLALTYGGLYSFLLMLGLAIMVGVSRLYLGVHYLSDVVAAVLLGLLAAYIISLIFPFMMFLHDLTVYLDAVL